MRLLGLFCILLLIMPGCINLKTDDFPKGNIISPPNDAIIPKKYSVIDSDIPLTYYGKIDGVEIGYQIAPHNVAMKSLEAFYKYHDTGEESYKRRGLYLADWLLANAIYKGGGTFVVWEYNYPWPPYNLKSGWTGSLNQATIIKALSFAYLYSKDLKYIEMSLHQ
ncbi:MAG: hypothetical protein APG08_00675 [Candidatus Methanofastidiosum methylothiophilum]|nr:MAG: hypothetical protein APG08_00675 [Candidatus Methanofastidiosum methylthiophilus]